MKKSTVQYCALLYFKVINVLMISTCSHVMNCQQIRYWYSCDELLDGHTERF